jgi:hypothetical protein
MPESVGFPVTEPVEVTGLPATKSIIVSAQPSTGWRRIQLVLNIRQLRHRIRFFIMNKQRLTLVNDLNYLI